MFIAFIICIICNIKFHIWDFKISHYENIFSDVSSQGNDIWIVSDRISSDGVNIGETWNYYRDEEIECDFEMGEVNPNCLIYVSDFKN